MPASHLLTMAHGVTGPFPRGNHAPRMGIRLPYFAAATIVAKSAGFRDAPPIRPPSTSGWASSSAALPAFIEPPYWITVLSATAASYRPAMVSRISLQTSLACSAVAVRPVPIAQTGS